MAARDDLADPGVVDLISGIMARILFSRTSANCSYESVPHVSEYREVRKKQSDDEGPNGLPSSNSENLSGSRNWRRPSLGSSESTRHPGQAKRRRRI